MKNKKIVIQDDMIFGDQTVVDASLVFDRNKKHALDKIDNLIWYMKTYDIYYPGATEESIKLNKSDLIRAESLKKILKSKIPVPTPDSQEIILTPF